MLTRRHVARGCAVLVAATLAAQPVSTGAQTRASGQTRPAAQTPAPTQASSARSAARLETLSPADLVQATAQSRLQDDLAAMQSFRPGYGFWQYVFRIPDGAIAYGSASDGRLLAVFPARGDWTREGVWDDPSLKPILAHQRLSTRLSDRRDEVAALLEQASGALVVHNPTRGLFVEPNAARYGRFLEEWARIYERFGVPADLGLAQGLVESGLNGTVRSEARAIGFCQWLMGNWNVLKRLSPHVIEGYNQTTQAPYCAAYLSVLATKYGSYIPALSEHHAGGTNVGRTLSNGQRLGGQDVREHYFMGAAFTRDIRALAPNSYSDVYGTYGPRSFYYAEMIFGNTFNVRRIMESQKQVPIYAMRTTRAIPLTEITRRTKLSADEVRRYNPALTRSVPARATLYLPVHVPAFGTNVSFWQRPAPDAYTEVLAAFMALDRRPEEWDTDAIVPALRGFERRFRATRSEEGVVMATVLGYVIQEVLTSGRGAILEEFRSSPAVQRQFERAVLEREAAHSAGAANR
jgi:hypothetical protein